MCLYLFAVFFSCTLTVSAFCFFVSFNKYNKKRILSVSVVGSCQTFFKHCDAFYFTSWCSIRSISLVHRRMRSSNTNCCWHIFIFVLPSFVIVFSSSFSLFFIVARLDFWTDVIHFIFFCFIDIYYFLLIFVVLFFIRSHFLFLFLVFFAKRIVNIFFISFNLFNNKIFVSLLVFVKLDMTSSTSPPFLNRKKLLSFLFLLCVKNCNEWLYYVKMRIIYIYFYKIYLLIMASI